MENDELKLKLKRQQLYNIERNRNLHRNLDEKDLDKICRYLENPTKMGIWILKAQRKGEFKNYIKEISKDNKNEKNKLEKNSFKTLLGERNEDRFLQNINKFTFVLKLFTYLYYIEKGDDALIKEHIEMEDDIYKELLEKIDLEKTRGKYNDAFIFFKTFIYIEDIDTSVESGKITKIKDGFLLFPEDDKNNLIRKYNKNKHSRDNQPQEVELISLTPTSLEKLKTFFEKIGFIENTSISPIYSPEEDVFAPYFSFLKQSQYKIIKNKSIRNLINKSILEYNDKNYPHCINTIGLITEEYLVQIYETLFRDICPKKPLGGLYDDIHKILKEKLEGEIEGKIEFAKYFEKIEKIEKIEKYPRKEIIKILRNIISLSQKTYSINQSKIKEIQSPKNNISIFNKRLRNNINEVIRNRNATSHRTRIPIGNYEALRSVYCCVTLILWWAKQKENIDWTKEPEEIIKLIINNN